MRVASRLDPGSPAAGPAYRLLMAASVARVPTSLEPAVVALRRALRTTAMGRIPRDERAWITRIEARRAEIASGEAAEFTRWMSIAPVWGRFLMRVVRELAPRSCLELGTAFGISAAYQAAALDLNGAGTLITLEGADALAAIAEEGLSKLELERRVEVRLGDIDDSLAAVLQQGGSFDFAFLDADHTEEATLSHFRALTPHLRDGAIVVLDDINWSDGMRHAWEAISGERNVSASLRLRRMGIVIFTARGGPR